MFFSYIDVSLSLPLSIKSISIFSGEDSKQSLPLSDVPPPPHLSATTHLSTAIFPTSETQLPTSAHLEATGSRTFERHEWVPVPALPPALLSTRAPSPATGPSPWHLQGSPGGALVPETVVTTTLCCWMLNWGGRRKEVLIPLLPNGSEVPPSSHGGSGSAAQAPPARGSAALAGQGLLVEPCHPLRRGESATRRVDGPAHICWVNFITRPHLAAEKSGRRCFRLGGRRQGRVVAPLLALVSISDLGDLPCEAGRLQ